VSPDPDSNPVPGCISALGESESTTTLGNFPVYLNEAVGTTFGQIPHVCGGSQMHYWRSSDQCWKLDGQTLKWSHAARMNEPRANAAGAHHPQVGFLVSGGWNGSSSQDPSGSSLSSTEVSTDGRTFSAYTPLPIGLQGHCMVALDGDDGEFFLAGGWVGAGASPSHGEDDHSARAFIHRESQWDEVEQMPTARSGLFCGPVRDSPGGRVQKIVAAGGVLYPQDNTGLNTETFTVEVYDISLNTWETGTSLPHPLQSATPEGSAPQSAAVVEHGNSFNIMGARDKILKYDPIEEKWIEMPNTLTGGGSGIKIKPSFFKSCQ